MSTKLTAARVRDALKSALDAMDSVTVFVTSTQRIKKPEGEDWWREQIAAGRAALQGAEAGDG